MIRVGILKTFSFNSRLRLKHLERYLIAFFIVLFHNKRILTYVVKVYNILNTIVCLVSLFIRVPLLYFLLFLQLHSKRLHSNIITFYLFQWNRVVTSLRGNVQYYSASIGFKISFMLDQQVFVNLNNWVHHIHSLIP